MEPGSSIAAVNRTAIDLHNRPNHAWPGQIYSWIFIPTEIAVCSSLHASKSAEQMLKKREIHSSQGLKEYNNSKGSTANPVCGISGEKEGEGMKYLDIFVTVLLVIGALNWGLVGLLGFNPLGAVFGETAVLARAFYGLVGLCGLYEAYNFTIGFNGLHHRWCETATGH